MTEKLRKRWFTLTFIATGSITVLRLGRGIITTRISQTVIAARQNKSHILLYSGLKRPKSGIKVRVVYISTVAVAPNNLGQESWQTRLISKRHVGMKRCSRRVDQTWMTTSMPCQIRDDRLDALTLLSLSLQLKPHTSTIADHSIMHIPTSTGSCL